MKVCLVNTNVNPGIKDFLRAEVQLGLLYLAAILEKEGHEVEIVDLNIFVIYEGWPLDGRIFKKAVHMIARANPDLIGINTRCDTFPTGINIARVSKKVLPEVPVVMGGFHVTFLARETLSEFPFVDFVLRGEAEYSMLELVSALENKKALEEIRGLTFRKNGRIVENPDAKLPENLDLLPMPAYHHYEEQLGKLARTAHPEIFINVGRGCPFHCEFCVCHKIYRGKYRLRSPENIIEEIKMLKEKYGILGFNLGIDHFLVDKKYVRRFCKLLIKKGLNIYWGCNARPEDLDEDLLKLMKKSGLSGIFFGIETASHRLQKKIRKNIKLESVLPLIQTCEQIGLVIYLTFVLGFPDETEEEINSTLYLALDCSTYFRAFVELHVFSPMAGSVLYDKVKDQLVWTGLLNDFAEGATSHIPENIRLVKKYPKLFSVFYSPPLRHLSPVLIHEVAKFYQNTFLHFPLTLKIAFEELILAPLDFFRLVKKWAKGKKLFKTRVFTPTHADLLDILPEFLREEYNRKKVSPVFMEIILRGELNEARKKIKKAKKYTREMGVDSSPLLMNEMFGHRLSGDM
ncbi:MAG: radical SAM protein [Candidatus Eremiobacteraeota bacterium]|nr:radical SAM protein [Candidatus Eremiobacteraeota bacterium]